MHFIEGGKPASTFEKLLLESEGLPSARAPRGEEVHHALSHPSLEAFRTASQHTPTVYSSKVPIPRMHAENISDIFREVYGDRYPYTRIYDPALIQEDVANGEYHLVALVSSTTGSVVAAGALIKFKDYGGVLAEDELVLEVGKIVVSPQHQGLGLGKSVVRSLVQVGGELGATQLFTLAVATHDLSQKMLFYFGFRPSGISVCDWPNMLHPEVRESGILMQLFLNSNIQGERTVYSHPLISTALSTAYGSTGCQRTQILERPQEISTNVEQARLIENIDRESSSVQIFLPAEADVAHAVKRSSEYVRAGAKHVSITLSLLEPSTYKAVDKLFQEGFRFSMVQPLGTTDLLTLQRAEEIPENIDEIVKRPHEYTARLFEAIFKVANPL